nr:anti-sigma regulatory factor [Deinobacterium chartae]
MLSVTLDSERRVVEARQRAKEIAERLGFGRLDQTRVATAVSELARNAFRYAGGGEVHYDLEGPALVIIVEDRGPGIGDLEAVLAGDYHSTTGMGVGLIGTRRLMDDFRIEARPGGGTRVRIARRLPRGVADEAALRREVQHLAPPDPVHEVQRQNQELLRTLGDLAVREQELLALNEELDATNRGIVALFSELEDKAERLRTADRLKSRFLWHMSHEFRSPLSSVLALSRMLMQGLDGELNAEQLRQVSLIHHAASGLLEMVNEPARHGQGRGREKRAAQHGVRGSAAVRHAAWHVFPAADQPGSRAGLRDPQARSCAAHR